MPPPILVTQPEFVKGQAVFRNASDWNFEAVPREEESLAAAVRARGARAVVVGVHPYMGPLYDALAETAGPHGALIARFGVGHDSIDKQRAAQRGILVTNTPGTLDQSVAEHTLWLMGALIRRIPGNEARLRSGTFQPDTGRELGGLTLGLLGLGGIGRRVAAIAHFGFGMRVWAVDLLPRSALPADLLSTLGLEDYSTDAGRLLAHCDVVSLHLAATPQTRHFFDARRLALLRPEALLINTARGSLVDEQALFDALANGRLAGAALDVYEREPYEPVDPACDLRRLENTVLTPHIASNTHEANRRMAQSVLANLGHFFAGRPEAMTRVGGSW